MTTFDPAPDPDGSTRRWQDGNDTFSRVYDVALGVTSPTPYTEIAEIADCSPNAAKKHLDRLVDMGIVRVDRESRPPQYHRNDGYLEWQEASRIAEDLTVEEIVDRVRALESEIQKYETRFEATDPTTVSVFDHDDHEPIHERMEAVSDWQAAVRDIRLYELARQLSQNDGHLITA